MEEPRENRQRRNLSFKISAIYATVGALWIFFSGLVAAQFADTPQVLEQIERIKGWVFVLLTAILIYNLVSRSVKRLEEDISERKRVEAALKESEMRFRMIFEHTAVGVAQVESNTGRFVRINRKFCDIVGYSPEEMIGRDFQSITHPDDLENSLNNNARLLSEEVSSYTVEKRYIHRNGTIVWVNLTVSPLWATGEERGFQVAVVEDITERKRAEESLQRSNARISHLNDVLHAIRDVGSLINREEDPIGLLNAVCNSLVKTRGYVMVWIGKPETDSKRVLAVAHSGPGSDLLQRASITWDDSPTGLGPSGTAIRERRAVVFDDLATDPRFALWRDPVMTCGSASIASVPLIHQERLFGVLTVKADRPHAFDLEEVELLINLAADLARALLNLENEAAHKRAADELLESENKFKSFAENALTGIYLLQDGVFKYVNPKFAQMFGYTVEECLDEMHYRDLVYKEDLAKVDEQVRARTAGEVEFVHYTFRGLKKSGQIFHVEVYASTGNYNGRPAATGTILDITDRKRTEEERKKLEGQLFQAQKMESVGRLAGGVAHDFNNMLGVIIGRAELALQQDVHNDKLRHNLKEILKAGRRSADLTRQLLAFARKQTVVPEVLDLNDTISGMLQMLRRLIGEDINLFWVPGLDLWRVKIDPSQVDQILANLAVNARDAVAGVGAITMKAQNVVTDESIRAESPEFIPGQYVLLTVSDTGAGMSQEVCEKIFEPFFTTRELGKGTGLGLSTVYGIVKQNNGFIYVASEPEKGTTFKIYLPRFEAETAQVSSGEPPGNRPTGTETILLVEDDEPILNLSKAILENLGYTVLAAKTPVQAIHLVEKHPGGLHLLITDVVMPEMNGRELAEQLCAIRPDLKCLYMSGYNADVITLRGILNEGINFIQKPFGSNDLAAKVRQVLDRSGQ